MDVRWYAVLALALAGATDVALAETFRCPLADRVVTYQQTPCAVPELPGPRPAPVPVPVPAPARPAPLILPPAHGADAPFATLTPRKREVLDLTARFERCRSDEPGFAGRTADLYQAW